MSKRADTSPATPAGAEEALPPRSALTGTQRKFLRGLAHGLEPVVHVGRAGITEPVIAALQRALADHELIKVKLAADRQERDRMAAAIEAVCDAQVVGRIGTIAVVYRADSDPEKRRIEFA